MCKGNIFLFTIKVSECKIYNSLFSCECVGKCNNVSHEKRIDVLHDMICNILKECSKVCNIKQKSAATNFCWSKNFVNLNRRH